ncbi:hypothetical protein EV702DRAFT_349790 [Suillus placidus]|uniref:Uncharacterized protein n=1 Tax=Suillus placidus TaxID=48579 RepID=A0A9P6ZTU5_9AGAM|nr:hypothetical protein EV702DRAFT_349790 [Suillus placidus]
MCIRLVFTKQLLFVVLLCLRITKYCVAVFISPHHLPLCRRRRHPQRARLRACRRHHRAYCHAAITLLSAIESMVFGPCILTTLHTTRLDTSLTALKWISDQHSLVPSHISSGSSASRAWSYAHQ